MHLLDVMLDSIQFALFWTLFSIAFVQQNTEHSSLRAKQEKQKL